VENGDWLISRSEVVCLCVVCACVGGGGRGGRGGLGLMRMKFCDVELYRGLDYLRGL
jgi:hypothetical protein